MVVELKPTEAKNEDGTKQKKVWTDFVPVAIPEARKKTAAVGCGTVVGIVGATGLVLMVLAVAGYFAAEELFSGETRRANIFCEEERCKNAYDSEYLHGRQACENREAVSQVYDDWMDLVDGRQTQCREYIQKKDGVYHLEVLPQCDVKPTFIVVDTNTGHSAVKAEREKGKGYLCMLFKNADFERGTLDQVGQFEYQPDVEEYDIHINHITATFFNFGKPVRVEDRSELGEEVNRLCPVGEQAFYHMENSDPEFRSQIRDLMDQYDVEYDDVFDFFTDIYVALENQDEDAVSDLMDEYWEIVGFLPTGKYSDVSQSGIGWGLNIRVTTWYFYDYLAAEWTPYATGHHSQFEWEGQLLEQGNDDDSDDDDVDDDDVDDDDADERRDHGQHHGRPSRH